MADEQDTRLTNQPDAAKDSEGVLEPTSVEPVPEEKHATKFAEFINKLSEEQWVLWQKIGGAILGLAAAGCLFLMPPSEGSFLPMNFIIAFGVAKVIPDVVEKQGERRISVGRIALIIAMGVAILGFVGYTIATQGFSGFFSKTTDDQSAVSSVAPSSAPTSSLAPASSVAPESASSM